MPEPTDVTRWRACVASPHHLASEAGRAVLRDGGNALDAAIAVNLTLGVVTPYLCGYGGDLFAMVWAGGELHCFDGAGATGAGVTLERARAAAGGDLLPAFGPLTVTVPGAVDGWFALLERFGTKSFAQVSEHALRYARDGFTLSARAAGSIHASASRYAEETEWMRIYGDARDGQTLRQPDLARTIETLARDGRDAYYDGDIARALGGHIAERGGFIGAGDLAAHRGAWVDPLRMDYRGTTAFEMPPPTQGVGALLAMKIAEGFDTDPGSADREHVLIESMKRALAEVVNVTDPRFMTTSPSAMLDGRAIDAARATIDLNRAGHPRPWPAPSGGTAYMCAADADGMLVSLIQSNWSGFGSGVTVPGWGINLHNRGQWFSLDAEHAGVIAPGKRPFHTLIPAMAFRGARPHLVFGSMGGVGQAQTHLQLVTRMLGDGMDPADAIDAPRWIVSPYDWSVTAEDRFAPAVLDGLRARGHTVHVTTSFSAQMGHANAIRVDDDGYRAASDPRSEGSAVGI